MEISLSGFFDNFDTKLQQTFICSESTIETLEKNAKYVRS